MPQYKGHEVSEELLKAINDDIKTTEHDSRAAARKDYATEVKGMLAKSLPKAAEGLSADLHIRDFISEIAERAQKVAPPEQKEQKPKETPEEMASRLQAENAKILNEERAKLRREAILNETVSIAIGKYGLDPDYKDAFITKLNSLHPVEVGDDKTLFRDGEGYLYDKNTKPAGSEFVAEKLLTAFPKLKVATTPGPDLHTPGAQKSIDKGVRSSFEDQIGGMLENIQKKAG